MMSAFEIFLVTSYVYNSSVMREKCPSIMQPSLSFHRRISLHCRHSVQQAAAFWCEYSETPCTTV